MTVEYLAASILNMAWHTLCSPQASLDVNRFENAAMTGIGLIPEILPRYRGTYFTHIFNGGYYAGYTFTSGRSSLMRMPSRRSRRRDFSTRTRPDRSARTYSKETEPSIS